MTTDTEPTLVSDTVLAKTKRSAQFRHVYMVITHPSGKLEKVECDNEEGECLGLITILESKRAGDWTMVHLYVDKGVAATPVARWVFKDGKAVRVKYKK
jgi:hypothetical protein